MSPAQGTDRGAWLSRLQMAFSFRSKSEARRLVGSIPRADMRLPTAWDLLQRSVGAATNPGLFLEFGVGSGASSGVIASVLPAGAIDRRLYGFDSFQGLPERWRLGVPKGTFRRAEPPKVPDSVRLVVGLFQDTLDGFLAGHPGEASFIHMDCDLYSSASYVLTTLHRAGRIVPGTVIDFDEYYNYPGWYRSGECRALREFCALSGFRTETIGIVPAGQQFAVRLVR